MCPPATRSWPLVRKEWPEQKMFAPACVAAVFVFVDGSQSVGLSPWVNWGQYSTLPVGSRCAWTAIHGQFITDENCPTVAGSWAVAEDTPMSCVTAQQYNATDRTFNHSDSDKYDSRLRYKPDTCLSPCRIGCVPFAKFG
jgi:hypothetical protein